MCNTWLKDISNLHTEIQRYNNVEYTAEETEALYCLKKKKNI